MTPPGWHRDLLREPAPPLADGYYAAGGGSGAEPFATIESVTDPDRAHGVLLDRLARVVQEQAIEEPVLEVGLHRSGWLAFLQRRGLRAVGLDASRAWVIEQARLAGERRHDCLLVHGDVTRLPLRDGSLGTVLAFDVLEHVAQPEQALAELSRVLRPGGQLLLHVPVGDREGTWEARWQARDPEGYRAVQASVGHVPSRIVPAALWRRRLAGAGLTLLREERLQRWVGPVHDYRLLPLLGRLRRRGQGSAVAHAPPGRDRYARLVVPPIRMLDALERRLRPDQGSSVLMVAVRP